MTAIDSGRSTGQRADGWPAAPPTTSRRHAGPALTIALGSAAVFFVALELTVIAIALPDISATFPNASRAALSWIFTAYNVGVAAFLLIGGWLAERFGRKRLFLSGLLVFTVGSLASGFAPGIELLIAARAVQAVGGALLIPASLAVVLHAAPHDRHDVAIAVWGAMAGLAAAVGPTLGSVLVDGIGWRSVFLVNVPLAVIVAVVGSVHLEESNDPTMGSRVDLLAVPAGATAIGLLVFIIVAAGTVGWLSPIALGSGTAAGALLGLFVRRSLNHPNPVFDLGLAGNRSFVVGSIGTLLFVSGFTGWLVFAPTFLTEVWDYSVFRAGFAIAPGPLAMAAVAGPAGRAAMRLGHGRIITAGAAAAAVATVWWVAMVGPEPNYLGGLLPGILLLGAGVGAGFPMLTAATMREVEPVRYAMGAAGATTVRQVAMAMGIAVVAAVVGNPDDPTSAMGPYRTSWLVLTGLFVATAVVATKLADRPGAGLASDLHPGGTGQ